MKKLRDDVAIDSILTTDEWNDRRLMVGEELKCCDVEGGLNPAELPLIVYFEAQIKSKLMDDGFKIETLSNPKKLELILKDLDKQGIEYANPAWQPPVFPERSVTRSDDNRIFWVKPDIDSALRTLESLEIIKRLLMGSDGLVNKQAVKIFLRSFELTINLARAGFVPEKALLGIKVVDGGTRGGVKSGKTRQEKAKPTAEAWQAEAEKIWRKHPTWGKPTIAEKVAEKLGGKPGTIRKHIEKTLP